MTDARAFGMGETEIEAIRSMLSAPRAEFSGVWPQNREAVDAFLAGASQWRTGIVATENGVRTLWIGLDYAGLKAALELRAIELRPSAFAGVQAMEMAAREALNG